MPFSASFFLKKIGLKIIFLHTAEAVAGRCSVKKVFLEIWQDSQENNCGRVSFSIGCHVIEKETLAQVFSCEFCQISEITFLYRTPPMAASDIGIFENSFLFYGQS